MRAWLVRILTRWLRLLRQLQSWRHHHGQRYTWVPRNISAIRRRVFAQPKPQWVKPEIIRLKALMPQAGCRTIAHHFNR